MTTTRAELRRTLEALSNVGVEAEAVGRILLPAIQADRDAIHLAIETADPRADFSSAVTELKLLRTLEGAITTAIRRGEEAAQELRTMDARGPERGPSTPHF